MVNNGLSRACSACKHRRKKCDETRPACLRCVRGRRECPGYTVCRARKFVNYIGEAYVNLSTSPTTDTVAVDWSTIEEHARAQFFHDYCLVSSNRGLSRGYLHGLQAMVIQSGPHSELTRACTIIALASLGTKVGNDTYLTRAKELYALSLRSFRLCISNETVFTSGESLITATLLGLYEIIGVSDAYPGSHVAHAKGISAILVSRFSPFDLVCGGKLFQVSNPLSVDDLKQGDPESPPLAFSASAHDDGAHRFSVMCTPRFNMSKSIIDMVYVQTEPLIHRAMAILDGVPSIEQVHQLLSEAEHMRNEYYAWPKTTPPEWAPRSVGVIALREDGPDQPSVGYWPGPVSSYYDRYVASIWNSYRKACLMVLNIMISCHQIINTKDSLKAATRLHLDVTNLTADIISSIPFLLSADLQSFLRDSDSGLPLTAGRPVGGLLSIHMLYILSTLPVTEPKLKNYARDCLVLIGDRMGIGQATALSKCTTMEELHYGAESRVIIWAGMLI